MLGMDWVGPITPRYSLTGAAYILLVINYFSRFAWAKAYVHHTLVEVVDIWENHISPIFGWPTGIYSDNGSHFVNELVSAIFVRHGVSHFTGPISHPSSTELLERGVQEIINFLNKRYIERNDNQGWSLMIREYILAMNTKAVRIHGYTPSQLMLGFNPQQYHFDTTPAPLPTPEDFDEESLPPHQVQIFSALRDENKRLSSEAASYSHYHTGRRDRKQRIPQPGDLVIVRHHAVDNQRERKLEFKWLGPRLLTRVAKHGLSRYVRELHGTGTEKRYHINDILSYHQREPVVSAGVLLSTPARGTTPVAISDTRILAGRQGGRAVVLS